MATVPPAIVGLPWKACLAVEGWRWGRVGRIRLDGGHMCAASLPDGIGPPGYPCYQSWLNIWGEQIYLNCAPGLYLSINGFSGTLENYTDPNTGLACKVVRISGTPAAADLGGYKLTLSSRDLDGGYWGSGMLVGLIVADAAATATPVAISGTAMADVWHPPVTATLGGAGDPCMPISISGALSPGTVIPPGPGVPGDCGQTTTFICAGVELHYCNNILNSVWNAVGQPSDWEEMAFYIAVMTQEGGEADAAGDCCPNSNLDCTRCITCAQSTHPTTCCCSFGFFQLNRCGGQGGNHGCAELLDPQTNIAIAMIALKSAWNQNKAAGHTGIDLYKRAAADSGHPGSTAAGEASRQAIANYTVCLLTQPLTFPLGTFGLVWPLHGALNADCAWHMASPENLSAIDINCGGGETIKAAHAGTITFAGLDPTTAADSSRGYGYMVKIEDAAYSEYETRYGHMQAGSLLVGTGDHVLAGAGLGLCGSTGNSTGPHLHFELRHNGVTLCPCVYLTGGC